MVELIDYTDSVSVFQELETEVSGTDEMILYSLLDGKVNKVIVHDGEEIGMVSLSLRYESMHIEVIYILKKHRAKGIGHKVVNMLKAMNNYSPITGGKITCCPFTDQAEDFFLKQGFEPKGGDLESYFYLTFNP